MEIMKTLFQDNRSFVKGVYSIVSKYTGKQLNYDSTWFQILSEITDLYIDMLGGYTETLKEEVKLIERRVKNGQIAK